MIRAFLMAALTAPLWAQNCTLPALPGKQTFPGGMEGRFCSHGQFPVNQATSQILIDDSGSMGGLRGQLGPLKTWFDQALSQGRQNQLEWTSTRACFFSSARPLRGCSTASLDLRQFRGQAETTLHEAIGAAADYDLTVIVTDGASASTHSTGDCAAGVDAACVARAMVRAVSARAGERAGSLGGIWLVPLVALHDGSFYTEQSIAPADLNAPAVAEAVARETSTTARITQMRQNTQGELVYDYTGPRTFLVLIVARQTYLGRAFVAALQARRDFARIRDMKSLSQFRGGLAALPAVELYPGAAVGLRWTRAQLLEPACLTMDLQLRTDGRLEVACSNALDEAVIVLTTAAEPESRDCAQLMMLPALRAEVRSLQPLAAIRDYRWSGSATDSRLPIQLALRVACSKNWRLKSGQCQQAGVVHLRRDLAATAAGLATGAATSPASALIRSISAPSVARAPHRVFQLQETLERFYRTMASTVPSSEGTPLAPIDFCRPR